MTAFTYTAKRSLTTGHSVDVSYEVEISMSAITPGKDVQRTQQRALGGLSESLLWRNKSAWSVTTRSLNGSKLDLAIEFLESVIGGEEFEFDEFGQAGAPDLKRTVVLTGPYTKQRSVRQGDGGRKDYFRLSFSFREA